MGNIEYKRIDNKDIDQIRRLWEGLTDHHQIKTDYFKERFETLTFESRKQALLEKANDGQLIIDVCIINSGKIIAYCVSSIDEKMNGEIDSLFVDSQYRRMKMGDELMKRALQWFDDNNVKIRRIVVAQGNGEANQFYEKFGFFPVLSTLQQKL